MPANSQIDLPFTPQAVLQVLEWGVQSATSPYSHKQIARWCERAWRACSGAGAPAAMARLLPVLADVDAQWDLHFAGGYTAAELEAGTFEGQRLPAAMFEAWLGFARAA